MSKSNALENAYLLLLFNNTNIANVGDATGLRGSSTAGSLHLSLHDADPGEAGDQTTNEVSYTGYGREAVARSGAAFTVTNNAVALAANEDFGERTDAGAAEVALYWGLGTDSSGAGTLLYSGPLGSTLGLFVGAASDTITIPGLSGLAVNDRIAFFAAAGSSLPAGLTEGTVYHVISVSTNDITVSATQGGAAVNLTGAGSGIAFRVTPITITQGVIPRVKAGTIVTED